MESWRTGSDWCFATYCRVTLVNEQLITLTDQSFVKFVNCSTHIVFIPGVEETEPMSRCLMNNRSGVDRLNVNL